jgi:hypothetical protein
MGESLQVTLGKLVEAWDEKRWQDVEDLSLSVLQLASRITLQRGSLLDVAKRYLGACLSSANQDQTVKPDWPGVEEKVRNFEDQCRQSEIDWILESETVKVAHELILLAADPSDSARCQMASCLRKLARPDLAIEIANGVLDHSRLNNYALATKGAALTDLAEFDAAIHTLRSALRGYYPDDTLERPLNALSRALRERGKRTGEIQDLQEAVDVAEFAYQNWPSEFSHRTYTAALIEVGDRDTLEALPSVETQSKAFSASDRISDRAYQIVNHFGR